MKSRCATCPMKAKAEKTPEASMSKIWKWHTTWCPGWKAYQKELAQSMGIMLVVKQVELGELLTAKEAFFTNSILEIMSLTRFNDRPIGAGKPGTLPQHLMLTYRELVAKET